MVCPVEIAVEKQLGLVNKLISRKWVSRTIVRAKRWCITTSKWTAVGAISTRRMGYWVNMDTAYITCNE